MAQFSEKLQKRLIEYFLTKYGLQITSEQAEDFLSSLANLYLAMNKDEQDKPGK